jgi:hypothetical protein
MRCAILQPSYVPWRGYFHLIQKSDVFIFYDDVQYDKHGWRNRNRVKTANGTVWLTIPVLHKGNVEKRVPIDEIRVSWDSNWTHKHWSTIKQSYGKAPHFGRYEEILASFYQKRPDKLVDFTIPLTIELARQLGITHTEFVRSSALGGDGDKTDRLIALLRRVGATHYISGPSAQDYIEPEKFAAADIGLEYMSYDYREYPQMHGPYEANVSIVDTLFMLGPNAGAHIWEAA